MPTLTPIPCAQCGAALSLHCGDHMPDGNLDLTLECDECDAPVLNAFVAAVEFQPAA